MPRKTKGSGSFTPLAKGWGGEVIQVKFSGLPGHSSLEESHEPEAEVAALTGEDQRPVCCVLFCSHLGGGTFLYCPICLWLSHCLSM